METNKNFWELQREISFEWNRYIINNPEVIDKIPNNAQVVFLLNDNHSFSSWSIETNKAKREPKQPVIFVHLKSFLPSRLVEPQLETAAC
ncbi:MAG: DUF5647 family protein [bacterium]|nr:hypothetical protein [Candidatus Omnitrophota bacterium]